MKICKKLFVLVLTLILLTSVFALPAMAEAEVAPHYHIAPCVYCGGTTVYCGTTTHNGIKYVITKCTVCGQYIHSEY